MNLFLLSNKGYYEQGNFLGATAFYKNGKITSDEPDIISMNQTDVVARRFLHVKPEDLKWIEKYINNMSKVYESLRTLKKKNKNEI